MHCAALAAPPPVLGQDERDVEGGLGVESETFGGPFGAHAALPHRLFNVGQQCGRVLADAPVACLGANEELV
jgi:hypothetical protein